MKKMKLQTSLLILLSGLLMTSACSSDDVVNGDDDNGDPTANDASMEVSGAIEAEYSGSALYQVIAGGAAHSITITFDDDEGTASFTIEGLTDEGTYEIGRTLSEPVGAFVSLVAVGALEGTITGRTTLETGSVTITDLEDNRIEGRFSATGATPATGNPELTVEGEFVATCTDAPGLIC